VDQSELKQLGGVAQLYGETITSLRQTVEDDSGCFVVFKSEHGFFMEHMDNVNAVVRVSL
jgi:hypothetical protein